MALPAAAQIRQLEPDPGVGTTFDRGLTPLSPTPDHQRRYTECMRQARSEPLKALPLAEKWTGEGGGLGARHCVAVAMFEIGQVRPAATQFEAIARDMGEERPGLRAELLAQAGQGWMEAGQAENAAAAQSRALDLKPDDADLWIDRGLSYAAMQAWPRAISDFDRALSCDPRTSRRWCCAPPPGATPAMPAKALDDAQIALELAPDHSEALLERGFAYLAHGNTSRPPAADFNKVIKLVPPGSDAARRAEAGLRGESPGRERRRPRLRRLLQRRRESASVGNSQMKQKTMNASSCSLAPPGCSPDRPSPRHRPPTRAGAVLHVSRAAAAEGAAGRQGRADRHLTSPLADEQKAITRTRVDSDAEAQLFAGASKIVWGRYAKIKGAKPGAVAVTKQGAVVDGEGPHRQRRPRQRGRLGVDRRRGREHHGQQRA